MTTRPEAPLPDCDRLAAWLALQTSEGALPPVWTSHVSECLSCYRFWTEWRDRPQQEAQLRAVLVDGQVDVDGDGAGLDLDDAFWRQLPARVYQEVMAPLAVAVTNATTAEQVAKVSDVTRHPLAPLASHARPPASAGFLSRFISRLLLRLLPGFSSRRLAPAGRALSPTWQPAFFATCFAACTGVALGACLVLGWQWQSQRTASDRDSLAMGANGHRSLPAESLGEDVASSGEGGGWLGALAELHPTELAALLRSQDEGGSPWETADEAFQELSNDWTTAWSDPWAETVEDALGGHLESTEGARRSSRQVRATRRP